VQIKKNWKAQGARTEECPTTGSRDEVVEAATAATPSLEVWGKI